MNTTTLQYIQDNYHHILKKVKRSGSREQLEDALSAICLRLLRKEYNITSPEGFVISAVKLEVRAQRRTDNRYVSEGLDFEFQVAECLIEQYHEAQEDASRLALILEKVQDLPLGQKTAVGNFLEFGSIASGEGNVNTQRANFKLAVDKLKGAV